MKKRVLALAVALIMVIAVFPVASVKAAEPWQEAYGSLLRGYIGQAQSFLLHDLNGTGIPEVFVFRSGINSDGRIALYTFFEGTPVLVEISYGGMGTGWGWSLVRSGEGLIQNGGYSALRTISHLILVGRELVTVQHGFIPLDPMRDYEAIGYFLAPWRDYHLRTGTHPGIPGVTQEEFNRAFPERLEGWEDKYLQLTEANIQSALAAWNAINVIVNGQHINFADQPPTIVDGRTLVPVRGVFEALGFDASWNEQARQVTLSRANDTIVITIDNVTFTANAVSNTLDVPAQIIGGRTMLPIRAVLESVGYDVDWDGEATTVIINSYLLN